MKAAEYQAQIESAITTNVELLSLSIAKSKLNCALYDDDVSKLEYDTLRTLVDVYEERLLSSGT